MPVYETKVKCLPKHIAVDYIAGCDKFCCVCFNKFNENKYDDNNNIEQTINVPKLNMGTHNSYSYDTSDDGCFSEDTFVIIDYIKKINIKELKKNDTIAYFINNVKYESRVKCIIEIKNNSMIDLIDGLTYDHPVYYDGEWMSAIKSRQFVNKTKKITSLYNIELYDRDVHIPILVNNKIIITGAIGNTCGTIKHPFYSTEKVLNTIAVHPTYSNGKILLQSNDVLRDYYGMVIGYNNF